MNLLITPQELSDYRNTSRKINTPAFEEAIRLAQTVDLLDLLNDFYFDIISNKDTPEYADLLNGSAFEYQGTTYIHEGIKSVLADFAYMRLVKNLNIQPTPFGMVTKDSENSNPVDYRRVNEMVKQIQIDANVKFKIVDKYLKGNFPNYRTENNDNINTFSQRFSIVKKL